MRRLYVLLAVSVGALILIALHASKPTLVPLRAAQTVHPVDGIRGVFREH